MLAFAGAHAGNSALHRAKWNAPYIFSVLAKGDFIIFFFISGVNYTTVETNNELSGYSKV